MELKKVISALLEVKYALHNKAQTADAEFGYQNGRKHYQEHMDLRELPATMTYEEYVRKAREVSLKPINGKSVRAFEYYKDGYRTGKSDGQWFVSYVGGKGGTLVTAFPLRGGWGRYEYFLRRDKGVEINKE